MKGQFWCMLLWLCLILGKYLAANVEKGYSQVGNESLHEVESSWLEKAAQKDIPVTLLNFFFCFTFDFEPICSILEFETTC